MLSPAGLTTCPPSGSSMPARILSSVVLPAPFGPLRPTRSRSSICHVTASSRTRSPKDLLRDESCINVECENVEIWKSRFPNYQISRLANLVLFAEGFRRRSQHAWHTEGLGEIARDATIHSFDGAGLVREASDDDHGEIGFQPARFADHGEPVDAGHLQVGDQQVI